MRTAHTGLFHEFHRHLASLLFAAVLLSPIAMMGCAAHASYRVYDEDHHDYHNWNHGETVYYQQWETSTHRSHEDFQKRNAQEQKEYWDWRHNQH